jgi:TonB family protein
LVFKVASNAIVVLTMSLVNPPRINDYPEGRNYAKKAVGLSLGVHILVVLIIGVVAHLSHVKSLRDLMLRGRSVEMHPSPNEERIEISLMEQLPPPSPISKPELIHRIVIPPSKPVTVEKPNQHLQRSQIVAAPRLETESRLVVGTSGLPHPGYPTRAKLMHISGTVVISVSFDNSGRAVGAEVVSSSGSRMLDEPTRSFILEHWHNDAFAGKTETVPVEYNLNSQ